MTHTYTWWDGLEVGNGSFWTTSGVGALETGLVSTGSRYAWRFNVAAQVSYLQRGNTEDNDWASAHIYFAALPASGQFLYLCSILGLSSIVRGAVRLNGTTGFLEVYSQVTGTWEADSLSYTVLTGKWYVLSMFCSNVAGQFNKFTLYDRDSGAILATKTHSSRGSTGLIAVQFGPYASSNGDVVFDNMVLEADPTATNIDDPVNDLTSRYGTGLILPIGTGFYDAWSGTYADVDDAPHDVDVTFRSLGGASGAFTQAFKSLATMPSQATYVAALGIWAVRRNLSAGNGNVVVRMRSGGTDSDDVAVDPGATYTNGFRFRQLDPATSQKWTLAAADDVEGGVNRTTTANTTRATAVYLIVLYSSGLVNRYRRVVYGINEFDPEHRVYDLEQNAPIPLEEVQPNVGWVRVTTDDLAPLPASPSAWDDETLVPIESVRYTQSKTGVELTIEPAADRFIEQLSAKISDSAGSI